jgi:hypothetical protein
MVTRSTFDAHYLKSLAWAGDHLVDWAGSGDRYFLNGETKSMGVSFGYFDAAIISADGVYTFLYKRLGTKGLLLKNNEQIREMNRSYYCADVYEYPAAFVTLENGKTCLVHCPDSYCRLEVEDVETGEIVTALSHRVPADIFHSRLEVSPSGKYLISKGWVWHPWHVVLSYKIEDILHDPRLLDHNKNIPGFNTEIATASFIDDTNVLLGSSDEPEMDPDEPSLLPPKHIGVWDLEKQAISAVVKVEEPFGHLIAINENYAWDLYEHPKLIDLRTGKVALLLEDIDTGKQRSSFVGSKDASYHYAYSRQLRKLAIGRKNKIDILSFE